MSFWYLTGIIINSPKYRYLSLGLLLLHTTIYKEAGRTMLDLPQTSALLLSTVAYAHLLKKHNIKAFIIFGLTIGILLSIKYAFPLIGIYIGLLLISALANKLPLTSLLVSVSVALVTYLTSYFQYFFHGHNLFDWLKFEWWRWKWYQGKVDNPKLLIFQVIFLGKYHRWWDGSNQVVHFAHWNLLWPVSLIGYLLSWVNNKIDFKHPLLPYKLWILISLAALSLGAYEDRFLTPLIPGFILFGVKFAADLVKKWDNN
jgi:hypothetical protein